MPSAISSMVECLSVLVYMPLKRSAGADPVHSAVNDPEDLAVGRPVGTVVAGVHVAVERLARRGERGGELAGGGAQGAGDVEPGLLRRRPGLARPPAEPERRSQLTD